MCERRYIRIEMILDGIIEICVVMKLEEDLLVLGVSTWGGRVPLRSTWGQVRCEMKLGEVVFVRLRVDTENEFEEGG